MTSVAPESPGPRPASPRGLAVREVAAWVAGIGLTVAFAVIAGLAGLALGVFGLSAVVLALVAGLLALSAGPWRRAALPLSVVGLALAAGGGLSTIDTTRIARNGGLLVERPAAAADLQGATLRRGLGSVVVDLRHSRFAAGERVRFSARSDAGRVVVVLPMDRCVDVDLRATPLEVDGGLGGSLVMSVASATNLAVADERWATYQFPEIAPFKAGAVAYPDDLNELTPVGMGGVSLLGRDLVRPWSETSQFEPVSVRRRTGRPEAAKLDLRLAAAGAITVNALPDTVGPLARDASLYDQVSDASWPRQAQLPPSPEQQDWAGRWRGDWSGHRGDLARWRAWERRVVVAARTKARLLAGPCASKADLRSQWVAARYALVPGNGDGHRRVLAVNGLGEVVARGAPSVPTASRSLRDIVRGTGLRILTAEETSERRKVQQLLLLESSR